MNPHTVEWRFSDRMDDPTRWRKPRVVRVGLTYGKRDEEDLFERSFQTIAAAFAVMASTPHHNYHVVTARYDIAEAWFSRLDEQVQNTMYRTHDTEQVSRSTTLLRYAMRLHTVGPLPNPLPWPLPNVWLGVRVRDASDLNSIPRLLRCPAAVRFVDVIPVHALDLRPWLGLVHEDDVAAQNPDQRIPDAMGVPYHDPWVRGLDWVIVGGDDDPIHPDWVRSIRDHCDIERVPMWFRGWGKFAPLDDDNWSLPPGIDDVDVLKKAMYLYPSGKFTKLGYSDSETLPVLRVGRLQADRSLDGETFDQLPEVI